MVHYANVMIANGYNFQATTSNTYMMRKKVKKKRKIDWKIKKRIENENENQKE